MDIELPPVSIAGLYTGYEGKKCYKKETMSLSPAKMNSIHLID